MSPLQRAWLILLAAICCELCASTCLKASQGFSRPVFTVGVVCGYVAAFYLLSRAMEMIPLGTAYAVWSGVGIIGTMLIGVALFREQVAPMHMVGITLILAGILVMHRAT